MQIFGKIEGQIVAQEIVQPGDGQNFKPYRQIQVLQKINEKASLTNVKDYDLSKEYNGKISEVCSIVSWAGKNGNSGITVSVLR